MTQNSTPAHCFSNPRPLNLSEPTFPAHAVELLDCYPAYEDFARIVRAWAVRKVLDADEIEQESALRLIKRNPRIDSREHWQKYSATVALCVCRDEWRKIFRLGEAAVSFEEKRELGLVNLEHLVSWQALRENVEQAEFERLVAKQGAALLWLMEDSTLLPAPARRLLEVLVEAGASEASFKKNGTLNGNAIAKAYGVSQSAISRQLPVIQQAAAEVLAEMEADEEMGLG